MHQEFIDQLEIKIKQILKKYNCITIEELQEKDLDDESLLELEKLFDDNIDKIVDLELPKLIGNGDLKNHIDLTEKVIEYGLDGGMIGRGVFSNPFAFNKDIIEDQSGNLVNIMTGQILNANDRLELLRYHLELWKETWVDGDQTKHYPSIKKFFKIYVQSFEGAVALRAKLMETKNVDDAIGIVKRELL
jgi:tRNA-dihydrouridine synthase